MSKMGENSNLNHIKSSRKNTVQNFGFMRGQTEVRRERSRDDQYTIQIHALNRRFYSIQN